jgi:thioredoxin reductase (NADPH)
MAVPVEGSTPTQIRAENFPDLGDEVMYPRLSEEKLQRLAEQGERRSFAAGETLYEQGQREVPWFVVERGRVRVLDRKPGKDIWIAEADAGTFLGDIAVFTGEPAIAECVADEPTDVIAFERQALRAMLASWPVMAELVLRTMMARREWHEANGYGVLRLIAPRDSRRAFEVRDLLERNLIPVKWYDVDTDPESAAMLNWLQIPPEETPVLVRNTAVLRNPSAAQVARDLGLRAQIDGERFDLVVLGGGPAGLAGAVYGGSEGLRTLVAEAWAPGGQAGTSTRIENYLGFPTGISGSALTRKATLQARRFDAVLSSFHRAVELARGPEGLVRVDLDDGQHALARTVVVATGARWRTLDADNVERFTGAGVYHHVMATDAERCRGEDVIVVGGGNSAGQAALHLSRAAHSVRIVVRGEDLAATMSRYLVDRIGALPNVDLHVGKEIIALEGDQANGLAAAVLRHRPSGAIHACALRHLFLFIGADPNTGWLQNCVATDQKGFVITGNGFSHDVGPNRRAALPLETTLPGVFAIGDVRAGSTKRVAAAVGEGAAVVAQIHTVLAQQA